MGKTIRTNSKYNHKDDYVKRNKDQKNKQKLRIFYEGMELPSEKEIKKKR